MINCLAIYTKKFNNYSTQQIKTRMEISRKILFTLFLLFTTCTTQAKPEKYALATAHPQATEAGVKILNSGGNAFDAAVAVAATLAVVEPYSSGIGGGGFWLLYRARDKKEIMLDGRERAPYAAHRDMFLDKNGVVIPRKSIDGALSAAIPGLPAALVYLAKYYGKLPLSTTLAPAIKSAIQGFAVDEKFIRLLKMRLDAVRDSPASAKIFLVNGDLPKSGQIIRQPTLAKVLHQLATKGKEGFYQGDIAEKLVRGVITAGGIWQHEDLRKYKVSIRNPVIFSYKEARIVSASPPSSGGIAMAEIFNTLSQFNLSSMNLAEKKHHIVEAMSLAYRDRANYLGDPDFVEIPMTKLTSTQYAEQLAKMIGKTHNATSKEASETDNAEGRNTTHYSIIDAEGNRVAATLSINYSFGSGVTVPDTGVLLNNQMDDFVSKPNTPNLYGLVGGKANSIEPGKRMLSSMSPSFVDDGQRLAILGTPGGSRIITMITLATLKFLEGADAKTIVSTKRFHHQYIPDTIQFEPRAFDTDLVKQLKARGHHLTPLKRSYGNMQIVIWNYQTNALSAATDPRGIGSAHIQ